MAEGGAPGSELAATLDDLLAAMLPRELLLDLAETDRQLLPPLRAKIASVGLLEIGVPEEQGGLGLGPMQIAELFRVAGWRLLPVGLRNAALVVAPMLAEAARRGLDEFRPQYADLVSGRSGAGCSVISPGSQGAELIRAARSGPQRLDGIPVWAAEDASTVALLCQDTALLVDLSADTAELTFERGIDPGQGLAALDVEQTPDSPRVFEQSWTEARFRIWHVGVFAELLGCAEHALDLSVQHARDREQFGRPIAQFQAVAHMLADMKARTELTASALARLVVVIEDGEEEVDNLLDSLRYFIPGAARQVCENAIQIHGGLGFTWEHPLHLYYRRTLQTQAALGGEVRTAEMIGRRLLGET